MGEIKKAVGTGFISGLFGSLCCVTPLVLVLLGLSGVSGAMGLASYLQQNFRWALFIPLGVLFLIGAIYFQIKRKAGVCSFATIGRYKKFVMSTIIIAVVVWALLIYVIVPGIFGILS